MEVEKKWRCLECGYLYTGYSPPEFCPECMAPGSVFQEAAAVYAAS